MIFVDTGAWFAVAVGNDPDHEAAMSWLRRNREPLVTTDYILAETATLIRMRDKTARGHRLAVRVASSAFFAPNRPGISQHSGRLFRSIPATHFGAFRPPL